MLHLIKFFVKTLSLISKDLAFRFVNGLYYKPQKAKMKSKMSPTYSAAAKESIAYKEEKVEILKWNGQPGKTVLLVHGWGGRGINYYRMIEALSEKGFNVVTFDFVAHGNSTGKSTNLPEMSSVLYAIVNHLKNVDTIVAHSLGASALCYAMTNGSQKLCDNIILISMPSQLEELTLDFVKTIGSDGSMADRMNDHIKNRFGKSFQDFSVLNNDIEGRYERALIIHDSKDKVVQYHNAIATKDALKNAKMITTHNLGHYRILSNSDVISQVTAFAN